VARVMVCDDSAVIRMAITRILETDPDVRVVARAGNGMAALEETRRQRIDVVVLDIEMPLMDGLAALPLLLRADPGLRVIVASTLTTHGAQIALRALRLGAADYIPKPSVAAWESGAFGDELLAKVKGLARLRRTVAEPPASPCPPGAVLRPAASQKPLLLAIGSSTGGPQALFEVLRGLGKNPPVPVVLTQHMPPMFTTILARHLTGLSFMPCAEARDGERLEAGRLYVAPGDRHLLIEREGGVPRVRLSAGPAENFCRPSVDPMLRSAAAACDGRVLVAMLTGMGHDGLAGTRSVVEAGGTAIAQDEAISVVWGMPGAVVQAGLCHAVAPLPKIGACLRGLLGLPPV
jgi:two-component system chemotaxis response regulator CheB